MNESIEAEIFNRELTALLSGRNSDGGSHKGIADDLQFAEHLSASDLSGESRVRHHLRARFAGRKAAQRPARDWFAWVAWFNLPGTRPGFVLAACAAVAVTVLGPKTVEWYFSERDRSESAFAFKEGFGVKDGSAAFGRGASPYESATIPYESGTGLSPGSTLGDGTDIITSLNVRDPSNLVAGPGAAPAKFNTEAYDHIVENAFQKTVDHPLSTFSIDVDAASYANVRRFLGEGKLPPKDAVRVEEMINYFRYDYPEPEGKVPFSITTELAQCPWNVEHKIVRVGLKGRSVAKANLPPSNLVFLIDSSGSMQSDEKMPLLKRAFRLLVEQLREEDRVAIVTYAGAAGLVLPSTSGSNKAAILSAIDALDAGGSTAGAAGIELAYKVAGENFMKKGTNRVILATDGDFNVGVTSQGDLVRLMEEKRKEGVFLSILGFGTENYKDSNMKKVADNGNGNYSYIDNILEAEKVLVQEMSATLLTLAKDVKIQVEFNPARAQAYRLIGYESRLLKPEDFNNDRKDAGELGAGHTVTALYEVIPAGAKEGALSDVDTLRYQKTNPTDTASAGKELLTVKFRYKEPDGEKSKLIVNALEDKDRKWDEVSGDFKFAASVAGFGMLLRGSEFSGDLSYESVGQMARQGLGKTPSELRSEFVRLIDKARLLGGSKDLTSPPRP